MGAPKVPAMIQTPAVSAKPTQAEKDAAKAALDQKKAALGKIQQDVFARSQGLRGAASMYDFAGRTPHLAGDPRYQPQTPATPATPATTPPPYTGPPYGLPGGRNPLPGDPGFNPFPVSTGRGPKGEHDIGPVLGGAPRNSGQVPGGPAANTVIGGAPANTGNLPVPVAANPGNTSSVNQARAKFGLQPIPTPTAPSPTLFQRTPQNTPGLKALGVTSALPVRNTQQPANVSTAPAVNTGHSNQPYVDAARATLGLKPLAATPATATPAQPVGTLPPTARSAVPTLAAPAAQPAAAQTVRQPTAQQTPAQTLGVTKPAAPTQPKPASIFTPAPVKPAAVAAKPIVAQPAVTLGGGKPLVVQPTPAPVKRQSAVLTGRK